MYIEKKKKKKKKKLIAEAVDPVEVMEAIKYKVRLESSRVCCKCNDDICINRSPEPDMVHLDFEAKVVENLMQLLYTGSIKMPNYLREGSSPPGNVGEGKIPKPMELLQLMDMLGINSNMTSYLG